MLLSLILTIKAHSDRRRAGAICRTMSFCSGRSDRACSRARAFCLNARYINMVPARARLLSGWAFRHFTKWTNAKFLFSMSVILDCKNRSLGRNIIQVLIVVK